jgi:hypothetical protein
MAISQDCAALPANSRIYGVSGATIWTDHWIQLSFKHSATNVQQPKKRADQHAQFVWQTSNYNNIVFIIP